MAFDNFSAHYVNMEAKAVSAVTMQRRCETQARVKENSLVDIGDGVLIPSADQPGPPLDVPDDRAADVLEQEDGDGEADDVSKT